MSKSKLVRLYAKNATEVTPGAFECNLDSTQLSNVVGMSLKTLIFRNNVYNIFADGDRKNNSFSMNVDTVGPITVEVPFSGFYTVTEILDVLVAQIQPLITFASPGDVLNMIIDPYSKKVVATISGASVMDFPGADTLNLLLGNTEATPAINNGSITFADFPDLGGLESVTANIASKSPMTVLNVSNTKQRITNSLGVVPVTTPFGGLQTFTQPDLDAAMLTFSYPEDMTSIRFGIRDVDGNRILDQVNHLVIEVMMWFSLD
jgi:hypothetical protein